MDCPQCGGTLATYALGGREASVCEDCGYVGIAAEHRGAPRSVESWDDALRRFYRAHGSDGAPSVDLNPPLSRPSDSSTESWDDALRRFYARQTGEVDEAAVNGATDGATAPSAGGPVEDADDEADEDAGAANSEADEDANGAVDEDEAADDQNDADGVEADAGGR